MATKISPRIHQRRRSGLISTSPLPVEPRRRNDAKTLPDAERILSRVTFAPLRRCALDRCSSSSEMQRITRVDLAAKREPEARTDVKFVEDVVAVNGE